MSVWDWANAQPVAATFCVLFLSLGIAYMGPFVVLKERDK